MKVAWIVDAQQDFMNPKGRLYVKDTKDASDPGSVQIRENLGVFGDIARSIADVRVFTVDWHNFDDAEISLTPDFVNTFPPHCMGNITKHDLGNPYFEQRNAVLLEAAQKLAAERLATLSPEKLELVIAEVSAIDSSVVDAATLEAWGALQLYRPESGIDLLAGAELIPELDISDGLVLRADDEPERGRKLARLAYEERVPVVIMKTKFGVFEGNTAVAAFVSELDAIANEELNNSGLVSTDMDSASAMLTSPEYLVVGVATDVCVNQAVTGLTSRGYDVTVLSDCIYGLGIETPETIMQRWIDKAYNTGSNVRVITLKTFLETVARPYAEAQA